MALPTIKTIKVDHKSQASKLGADLAVVVVSEGDVEAGALKSVDLQKIDAELGGVIAGLVSLKDFEGKWLQTSITLGADKGVAKRVLLVGAGKKTDEPQARAREIGLKIAGECPKLKAVKVAVMGSAEFLAKPDLWAQLSLGFRMGVYKYPNPNISLEARAELETPLELTLVSAASGLAASLKALEPVAHAIDVCRLLQDGPPNVVTPKYVAEHMAQKAQAAGLTVNVYGAQKLREMGLNAMMAVAGGSANEPQFVVVEYKPAQYKKTIAFVGKGLTMDTGGYSIKTPSTHQIGMKYDMSGAAVTLSSILAIAELKLPVHVFAVAALCENMIDAHAYRVGDIIKTYAGKTIEILNTDAEGRVVLCDALAYTAKELKPDCIVEYSTLTGAIIVALGNLAAGLFSFPDETFGKTVQAAAEASGERVWPMPTYDEVGEDIKGQMADLTNLGATAGAAGSSAGAMFLKEFVENIPFAHVDIAGVANGNMALGYPRKISSGYGVQLSVAIAKALAV